MPVDASTAAALPPSGDLAHVSPFRLFYLAAVAKASGRLTVRDEKARRELFFKKGTVEHASSTAPEDDLLGFLVMKGALKKEQLENAQALRAAAGGDAVAALFRAQLVSPAEVADLLKDHGTAVVARTLACERGTFTWELGVAPPASSFPLGNPFTMLCSAARAIDLLAARMRLGDKKGQSATRRAGRVKLEELRLTPQEARLVNAFDGRSLDEMTAAAPQDAASLLRLALLLDEAELLSFGPIRRAPPPAAGPATSAPVKEVKPPAGSPSAPASPPSPPKSPSADPPAGRPQAVATPRAVASVPVAAKPTTTPELGARFLRELATKLSGKDHFEVLGVKRDATALHVKNAYFALAKIYHPDAVPAASGPQVRDLAADVFARVSEAWGVLGDDAKRAQYVAELASGGASKVDLARIFEAENIFQLGTKLLAARRYDEGLAKFKEAMALNANEPEFGIWKAWAEFLIAKDRRRAYTDATRVIQAELDKNPRCAEGYLFLGKMAKLLGETKTAERHLKRGLEAVPDHIDLTRELRYLDK